METADRLQSVQEYYFSKKLREIAQLKKEGKPIINIAIGSPDLSPSPIVVDALQKALVDPVAHKYQSYQGIPELRESFCNFYSKYYDVDLLPGTEVLPLMGSKEGIMHISMAFLNKNDKVLIPNPGYPTYESVTRLVEAEPVFYNLKEANNWLPDFAEIEKEDLSKVKLMWINYPHMPTGAVANHQEFEKLVDFAKRNQILLVNDNPYSFILNDHPQSILAVKGAKEVALELNSLSKSFNLAGWRVGMVAGNAALINAVLQVKSNFDSGMFFGIQKGAVAALNLSENWFVDLNKIYAKRRALVWKIFDKLNCTYDKKTGGLFVWARIPKKKNSEDFTDNLLYKKDVFITPGTIFGSNGEGFIRASLCVNEEQLNEVLDRLNSKDEN